ncbi:hypothetical protein AX16_001744 [Volvariella volvacea WC 439]|nr:hypothetical protein AX16_001744 [Volvariella volvacea WC 439]
MSSLTDAQLRSEIAKLTASINQHKSTIQSNPSTARYSRNYSYVNPNYKPPSYKPPSVNKYAAPRVNVVQPSPQQPGSGPVKEVVLNGVAFESSSRSLVRKDLPKPPSHGTSTATSRPSPPQALHYQRKSGHLVSTNRVYKPKHPHLNKNMTLTNARRPYQKPQIPSKRKYTNKPCPRFSTTGTCNRARTCMYQHDPAKIAICWNFLQGNCQNTAETCNLSHDPIPERTPLCMHFISGSCTRENCPFPHVNVGARSGVCRDFAVLGYCEKGLDCDKQHVRECPDFAEKGTCSTKGCKLPHVIRANRNRKAATSPTGSTATKTTRPISPSSAAAKSTVAGISANVSGLSVVTTNSVDDQHRTLTDAQLGDEYISLTFNESDSDDDDDEEDGESSDEESGDDNDDDTADGNSSEGSVPPGSELQ